MKKARMIEDGFDYKIIADYTFDWETWEDETGKLKYVSPACERISGYSADEFLSEKKLFDSIILNEDKKRWTAHRIEIVDKGGEQSEQLRIMNKNGAIVWIEHHCRAVRDDNNAFLGYRANNRDITKLKESEAALRESEERFKTLFDHSPIAILEEDFSEIKKRFDMLAAQGVTDWRQYCSDHASELVDCAGAIRIIDVNQTGVDFFHAGSKEHFDREISKTFMEESLKTFKEEMIALAEGKTFFESEMPVKDNKGDKRILWMTLNVDPVKKDTLGRVMLSFYDITERKRLETALAHEKRLLETTLISVADGVISTDKEGRIVFLNRVAEHLTGWTQETAFGEPINEVFGIVDEITKKKIIDLSKIKEGTHPVLISKDGAERIIECNAAQIIQDDGVSFGDVLVFRDFTEKRHKQEEIEYLSYHDQLTGLYNRRFYEEELKRLDTPRNLPLTLLMGDVNGLKALNDSIGHAKGDELLRKAAGIIRKGCRCDDIIARLGGDEFIVILPKTDESVSDKIIERIKGFALKEKVGPATVSISFGCGTKSAADKSIRDVFKIAEDNMYKDKIAQKSAMKSNS